MKVEADNVREKLAEACRELPLKERLDLYEVLAHDVCDRQRADLSLAVGSEGARILVEVSAAATREDAAAQPTSRPYCGKVEI
jgi:hypothetical protein